MWRRCIWVYFHRCGGIWNLLLWDQMRINPFYKNDLLRIKKIFFFKSKKNVNQSIAIDYCFFLFGAWGLGHGHKWVNFCFFANTKCWQNNKNNTHEARKQQKQHAWSAQTTKTTYMKRINNKNNTRRRDARKQQNNILLTHFLSQFVDSFFESICWLIFRVILLTHFLSCFVDQFFSLFLKTTNATCEKRNLLTHFWLN